MKPLKQLFFFVFITSIQLVYGQHDVIFNMLPESSTGAVDGQVTLSFTDNLGAYQFVWTGVSITTNTMGNQNQYNLTAGEYCVTITDASNCIAEGCIDVVNCEFNFGGELLLSAEVPCETGLIDLEVSGGVFPYSYYWEYLVVDGTGISMGTSDSEDLIVLNPGSPCVTVTDACGVATSACYKTSNRLGIELIASNSICQNGGAGSLDIAVTHAFGSVQYLWDTGATTEDLTNLSDPGTYCLTITDSRGCTTEDCFVLEKTFSIDITVGNTCSGNPTGFIEVVPPQGGNYEYAWDLPTGIPGNPTQTNTLVGILLSPVSPGIYGLTVTDDFGCTATELIEVSIDNETSIIDNYTVNNICGSTGADGSIEIYVNGNPASYSFTWSNGENTRQISDLSAGNYCLTITNLSTECIDTECFDITTSSELQVEAIKEKSCPDQSTGSIALSVTGGTLPYSYQWSNGDNNLSITNVNAGFYSVTISDANACRKVEYFNLLSYPQMNLDLTVSDVCFALDGAVDLTVTGGTPPYTYQWDNGINSEDLSGLSAGNYCVVVYDAKGCRRSNCIEVDGGIAASLLTTPACEAEEIENQRGFGQVFVNGSNPPFTASWSNGASGLIAYAGLSVGPISVTVTDNIGCSTVLTDNVENEFSVEMRYGFPSTCTAKYYCGEEKVGSKTKLYDKEWAWLIDQGGLSQWNYDNPCAQYRVCPIDGVMPSTDLNKDHERRKIVIIAGVCYYRVMCITLNPLIGNFIPIMKETECCEECPGFSPGNIPHEVSIFKDSKGSSEYFVFGHNSSKDTTYLKTYDAEISSLEEKIYPGQNHFTLSQTTDQGAIFAGSFSAELTNGDDVFGENKGGNDMFIAKYNKIGAEISYTGFGSVGTEEIQDVVTDEAGNIYATGFITEPISIGSKTMNPIEKDAFVMKSNAGGTILWVKQIGGSFNESGLSIDISADGTVYVAGVYDGGLYYENVTISPSSNDANDNGFLLALDSEGVLLWNTEMLSTSEITGVQIVTNQTGDIVLIANYHSDVQLSNNPIYSSNENNQFFIGKYNNSGNLVWFHQEGSGGNAYANGLVIGQLGDIYVLGDFDNVVQFSNDSTLIANGESDVFINQYSSTGVLGNSLHYGSTGADYGNAITAADGEIAFVGHFYGEELTIEDRTFTGQGFSIPQDYLVVFTENFDGSEIPQMKKEKEDLLSQVLTIEVFPNPFNSEINLMLVSPQNQELSLKMMNVYGQVLINKDFALIEGENTILLETQKSFKKGTYFLQLMDESGNTFLQKIVKL